MTALRLWGVVLLLAFALGASAQSPKLEPGTATSTVPTVTFTFDWEVLHPPHYSIAVDSAGRGAYTAVDDQTGSGEPYMVKFTVTQSVRERIFADAEALNYFRGQFDFTRHRIAFTGSKTLSYADPTRHSQTVYNWSENTRLMALTDLFTAMANTFIGGRKLEYQHRFDRLGLNDTLKEMETQAKNSNLAEVHVIEPVLHEIADDPAVMNIARQRARRLLDLAAAENASLHSGEASPKTVASPN